MNSEGGTSNNAGELLEELKNLTLKYNCSVPPCKKLSIQLPTDAFSILQQAKVKNSKLSMIREDFTKKVEENEEHKKENILVQENQPKRSKKYKKFTPDEKRNILALTLGSKENLNQTAKRSGVSVTNTKRWKSQDY